MRSRIFNQHSGRGFQPRTSRNRKRKPKPTHPKPLVIDPFYAPAARSRYQNLRHQPVPPGNRRVIVPINGPFTPIHLFTLLVGLFSLLLTAGCDTDIPVCSKNYCVVGEIFPRDALDGRRFDEISIDDSELLSAYQDLKVGRGSTPEFLLPEIHVSKIQSDVEKNGQQSAYIEEVG